MNGVCVHIGAVWLHSAVDEDGNTVGVYRCRDCDEVFVEEEP